MTCKPFRHDPGQRMLCRVRTAFPIFMPYLYAMGQSWHRAVLVHCEAISQHTRRFFFEMPELERYDFEPGQFVMMQLPIHEEEKKSRRSYSIASRPDGTNRLEFVIVQLDGGAGTAFLFNHCEVGREILISSPLGRMGLHEPIDYDVCYIATGTGIAPFRSMLHDLHHHPRPHRRLDLIFGTRTAADLLYVEEMRSLERDLEGFHYHPTLSREAVPGCRQGYVHPVYQELYGDRAGREDVMFYICGWGDMIRDARKNLLDMGFSRKQIHFESYG